MDDLHEMLLRFPPLEHVFSFEQSPEKMKEDDTDSSGVNEIISKVESVLHENDAVLQVRLEQQRQEG